MKKRMVMVLAAFWLLAAQMQSSPAQTENSSKFRVDVDLITVEVTAVDKSGTPVGGLRREDFQVYEEGRKQEIASIDEVKTDAGVSSLAKSPIIVDEQHRGKTVLIVFNDALIAPENIKKSRESAARFVREHMGPQDLFGVAVFSTSMKILQNMTTDREKVLAAIGLFAASNSAGMIYADLYSSLEQINYSLAHLKGRKNILIFLQSRYFNPNKSDPNVLGYGMQFSRSGSNRKTLESARRANVVYYTIDTVGLASGDVDQKWRTDYLDFLTRDGGYAISNTNNIDAELDKLDLRLSNYYILGFQSGDRKHDGAYRKLEIKTNVKGMSLRYLPGYQDRSPVDVLTSSRQEQSLLNALANPGAAAQIPMTFRPFYFFDTPNSARVLVSARIQTGGIALKKKDGQWTADLNVMGAAYGEDGSVAARFSEPLPVRVEIDRGSEFRKGALPYSNYFKLRPGKYLLKVAASDGSGNIGSMEQSLEIPVPGQGVGISSLVLAEQATPLPELIRNLQTEMLDESDPLVYAGMQISPCIENRLRAKGTAAVYFRIYNLPGGMASLDLVARPRLVDEKGSQRVLDLVSLRRNSVLVGRDMAAVAINLPLTAVGAGKYRLVLELADSNGGKLADAATELELMP